MSAQQRSNLEATQSARPMAGRVCLVTGSTSGIGKPTAAGLAAMGATVIVVGRDQRRGEAAVAEIRSRSGNQDVQLMIADLSSQASIRELARAVIAQYQQLHVLINNAGGVYTERSVTVDGIEKTFALNHLAYFLLANLLLDLLKASATETPQGLVRARIVNVSSEAQRTGAINFDDLQGVTRYRPFRAYSQSKLANVLFTFELAERLAGTNVTANCLHPGVVASGFGRNNRGLTGWLTGLIAPFLLTPEQGAQTSIYLASAPEVEGVSGNYFIKCKVARPHRAAHDPAIRRRLWDVSAELTQLPS